MNAPLDVGLLGQETVQGLDVVTGELGHGIGLSEKLGNWWSSGLDINHTKTVRVLIRSARSNDPRCRDPSRKGLAVAVGI